MANTDQATGAKRQTSRRSFRGLLDAAGEVTTKLEDAVATFFALRTEDEQGVAARWVDNFETLWNEDRERAKGYMALGQQTKHGNEANTVFNPGEGKTPGTVQEAVDWINEWRGQADWARERTGPRIDIDKLADAVVAATTDEELGGMDRAKAKEALLAKFEAAPELVKDTMNTPEYGNKYRELTARKVEAKTATLAKLFG